MKSMDEFRAEWRRSQAKAKSQKRLLWVLAGVLFILFFFFLGYVFRI
jgi:hypothetical protein